MSVPPCATDPARWGEATAPDAEAQALCRTACPMRSQCLDQALKGTRVMGIWGGLFLPDYEKFPRRHKNRVDGARHALQVVQSAAS